VRKPRMLLTEWPKDDDRKVIADGLADFNEKQAGYRDSRPLAVLLRDPETSRTLGGFLGRTSYGLLFIDLVYLPDDHRGQDFGSRMLKAMEDEAINRGCKAGFLITISFQAPGFYAKHGWKEFGRIDCDPPGTSRITMTKTFRT
jgi:GNAT superfamily N-acetyltransferase